MAPPAFRFGGGAKAAAAPAATFAFGSKPAAPAASFAFSSKPAPNRNTFHSEPRLRGQPPPERARGGSMPAGKGAAPSDQRRAAPFGRAAAAASPAGAFSFRAAKAQLPSSAKPGRAAVFGQASTIGLPDGGGKLSPHAAGGGFAKYKSGSAPSFASMGLGGAARPAPASSSFAFKAGGAAKPAGGFDKPGAAAKPAAGGFGKPPPLALGGGAKPAAGGFGKPKAAGAGSFGAAKPVGAAKRAPSFTFSSPP